jgi:hypothetical protein
VNPLDELSRLVAIHKSPELLFDSVEHLPASLTPEPYRRLLAHDHHMTLAMEEFHGHAVEVHVVDRRLKDNGYFRTSVLTVPATIVGRTAGLAGTWFEGERAVQFGAIRFNFEFVTAEVREEIIAEHTPLGQVLINHNVLRHIDLGAMLKIGVGPELAELFGCERGTETYGRLATIFCNRRPAVDLLEVSAPLIRT